MDDPDAPRPTPFVHWLLWNIPANTKAIAKGQVPSGAIQGQNSRKDNQYTGPCPPSGTHHYHFQLFALNNKPNLQTGASKEDLKQAMQGHILAQTELIGLYKK
jgi:Raf kinase inhibitor-like YbhB/YbcL family protein